MRPRPAEKRLELIPTLPPDLPADVLGDAVRLKQVLLNLTGNAIKFTARGQVEIAVPALRSDAEGAVVRFSLRDIGMDAASQKKLFQEFSRGDSLMTRSFGGLGLAIVQRLVNRLGGNIGVQSEPGQGSELTLPHAPKPPDNSRSPFLPVARPSPVACSSSKTPASINASSY